MKRQTYHLLLFISLFLANSLFAQETQQHEKHEQMMEMMRGDGQNESTIKEE